MATLRKETLATSGLHCPNSGCFRACQPCRSGERPLHDIVHLQNLQITMLEEL